MMSAATLQACWSRSGRLGDGIDALGDLFGVERHGLAEL
jgi:hypothetical protein